MSLTVKGIKKICKEKGIKGYSKMKKAELKEKCLSAEQKIKTMTIPELKKMCKKNGIKGYSKMKKAELMKHCIAKKAESIAKKESAKVESPEPTFEELLKSSTRRSAKKLLKEIQNAKKPESLKATQYALVKSDAKMVTKTPPKKESIKQQPKNYNVLVQIPKVADPNGPRKSKKSSLELAKEIPADDARKIKKIMLERFEKRYKFLTRLEILEKLKQYVKYDYVKMLILKYFSEYDYDEKYVRWQIYDAKNLKFKNKPAMNNSIVNFFRNTWIDGPDFTVESAKRIYKKNPEIAIAISSLIMEVEDVVFDMMSESKYFMEEFEDQEYMNIVYFG